MFTQTAVRVAVLQDAGSSSLATINLAQASVGPNVTRVVDPCVTNCGPGNPDPTCTINCTPGGNPDPNCTSNCSTGSTPGSSISSAANRLAYTGAGIAALIAVILALLAGGAYLARQGYRRSHAKPIALD